MGQDVVAAKFIRSDVVRDNDQPFRFAKQLFGSGSFLERRFPWPQSESMTRMEPSSRRISTGLPESGRWSKKSKLGSASSSGIHSRMACLAVMAVLDGPSRIPPPGGLASAEGPIAWIADNQLKGISAEPAVIIHATHAFSLDHWDRDREESGRALLDGAAELLGAGIKTFQVHGWRYSKPMRVDEEPCVLATESPPLVLAGDAFAGPRVEGAALSGWAAAGAVLAQPRWKSFRTT